MPDEPKEPPLWLLPENPGEPEKIILIYRKDSSPEERRKEISEQLRRILTQRMANTAGEKKNNSGESSAKEVES